MRDALVSAGVAVNPRVVANLIIGRHCRRANVTRVCLRLIFIVVTFRQRFEVKRASTSVRRSQNFGPFRTSSVIFRAHSTNGLTSLRLLIFLNRLRKGVIRRIRGSYLVRSLHMFTSVLLMIRGGLTLRLRYSLRHTDTCVKNSGHERTTGRTMVRGYHKRSIRFRFER